MLALPQGFSFVLLWTLAAPLSALLSAVIVWFLKSAGMLSPAAMEILFSPVYWIAIGLLQWQLLKSYGSWSSRWGVVTAVGGIIIIGIVLAAFSMLKSWLAPGGASRPSPIDFLATGMAFFIAVISGLLTGNVDDLFLLGSGWIGHFIAIILLVVITVVIGAACFISGAMMGWIQWLTLQSHAQYTSRWLLISGVAWLIGFIVFPFCYFVAGIYILPFLKESQVFWVVLVALIGSGIISSLIEGIVLVSLLGSSFTV